MPPKAYDPDRVGERHYHDNLVASGVPRLDLTSERFLLGQGDCSMLIGADVVKPGGLRNERPRLPVGAWPVDIGGPISGVMPVSLDGFATVRYRGHLRVPDTGGMTDPNITGLNYDNATHAIYSDGSTSPVNPFSAYTWFPGDWVMVYAPAARIRSTRVVSKASATTIIIEDDLGASLAGNAINIMFVRGIGGYVHSLDSNPFFTNLTGLIKDPILYRKEGPWPESMVDALIVANEDFRGATTAETIRQISRVETSIEHNDTIRWDLAAGSWLSSGTASQKFHILRQERFDRRGIWVTDGRRFWILRDGVYTIYADLGSDDYLGQAWRGAEISSDRIMFTCPSFPPIVFNVNREPSGLSLNHVAYNITRDEYFNVLDDGVLAGCLAPIKPLASEPLQASDRDVFMDGTQYNNSWHATPATSQGALSAGNYRAIVRAVNRDEGMYSRPVDVYSTLTPYAKDIACVLNDAIRVHTKTNDDSLAPPPVSKRWTHFEIFRTRASTLDYHRESSVEYSGDETGNEPISNLATLISASVVANTKETIEVSDTTAVSLPQLNQFDLDSGYLPPICQRVVNLLGVVFAFGKADAERAKSAIVYSQNFRIASAATYTASTRRIVDTGVFTNYTWMDGDELVITFGGLGGAGRGPWPIASRVDADTIALHEGPPLDSASGMTGYIRRPYAVDWPAITNDEEVRHSRTDLFAPESFVNQTIILGRTGDTFRNAVKVGDNIAVIMDKGVHILFIEGTSVVLDTIAITGEGTPWPESVVVLNKTVLWASPDGPKAMQVSKTEDADGHKAQIRLMEDRPAIRQWFRDAFNLGHRIDAGIDTNKRCIRWRRKLDDNTYQTAQFSYMNGLWTLLDDDAGAFYAASTVAEGMELLSGVLYSVGDDGSAFRVNYDGLSDPLASATVQGVLGDAYAFNSTKIFKVGAFSPLMQGMSIRFRSTEDELPDVVRIIRTAKKNEVTFDTVPDLAATYEFIIGATYFRMRGAMLAGESADSVKNLHSLSVRALPSDMHKIGGPWPQTPDGKITVRTYRDFADDASDTDFEVIPVYAGSNQDKSAFDRASSVRADGCAVEVEIECSDARTHFAVESIEAAWSESGDVIDVAKKV